MIPDLRDRELSDRMRGVREDSGMSASHVSKILGITQGQMSRIETGQRRYAHLHAATVLGMCTVPAGERAEILAMARGADDDSDDRRTERDGWVRPHLGLPSEAARTVLFAHTTATSITGYHPSGLPMILRTKELLDQKKPIGDTRYTTVIEAWWCYRALLNAVDGPGLLYYLHETGLRSLEIPAAVRAGQFIQLAMLVGQDRVRLRIVPAERDPGLGAFTMLRFSDPSEPVVCVPGDTASLVLEGQHVPAYQRRLEQLNRMALSHADSQELIMKLIDGSEAVASVPVERAITATEG